MAATPAGINRCVIHLVHYAAGNECYICTADHPPTPAKGDPMPQTPEELAEILEGQAFFSADKAYYIASEVYQPLLDRINELQQEVDQVNAALKRVGR